MKQEKRKIFHNLVTLDEVKFILDKNTTLEASAESASLEKARGRVLAESVFSSVDLPSFDRSEMDGFAVFSEDLENASERMPVKLRLVGSIKAGDGKLMEIRCGECMEIATGAPLPRGADSVVMVEYTKKLDDSVEVLKAVTPAENVASVGSDIQIGEMILRERTIIGILEIGVLAAVGTKEVKVVRRPRIGIISTGDELVDVGEKLDFGKIYDVNSFSLNAAVDDSGGIAEFLGRVADDYGTMKALIKKGLSEQDALIISGGTSAGVGDLVYRVLEEVCNPGILVHGINVKPGKPTVIAADNGKPVFGLPGYPVSALIVFDQIVRPYIERMGGRQQSVRRTVTGKLSQRVNGAKGRRWFLPVHLLKRERGNSVYPIYSSSGAIGTLAKADGYITVREDVEFLDVGEVVEVSLFSDSTPDLTIMGSHCPGIDLLLHFLQIEGISTKTANIGSLAGLNAIVKGEADLAGVHLLDDTTMKYNESFVLQSGLPKECLVKGYKRLQGIIVSKDNPKGVKGIEDALRPDIVFVNRNRGSGTRALTEHLLVPLANAKGVTLGKLAEGVRGFRWEAKTHSAVAAAIKQGRADMGIGIKSAAEFYKLDFIPLGFEEFDFVVNPGTKEELPVKAFLKTLKEEKFLTKLKELPGYSV